MVRTKSGRESKKKASKSEEVYYEVEGIMSRRESNGVVEYLVKWKGYDTTDWMQPADLTPALRAQAEKQFQSATDAQFPADAESVDRNGSQPEAAPSQSRRERADARQRKRNDDSVPVIVEEQILSSDTEIEGEDEEDWDNNNKKKKKAKVSARKNKKEAVPKQNDATGRTERRGRPRKVRSDHIDNAVLLTVKDVKLDFKVRKLVGFERDTVLHQLATQGQPNVSDVSSEGIQIPTAVLEIEDMLTDGTEELSASRINVPDDLIQTEVITDVNPAASGNNDYSPIPSIQSPAKSQSPIKTQSPVRTQSPVKRSSPQKGFLEDCVAAEEEVIATAVGKKVQKEYSPTKIQEVHTLLQPHKEVTKNRLAARHVDKRVHKTDHSSQFMEIKRLREEAKKKSLAKAAAAAAANNEAEDSQSSQNELEAPVKVASAVKKQTKVEDDDGDEWGAPAPVRSASKIPKPVAPPPLRKERRSISVIPAKAAPQSSSKTNPKPDPKKMFPPLAKVTFKIPKKTSKDENRSAPDWHTDWKAATGVQNWSSASTTVTSAATGEDSSNRPAPPPLSSYSNLLPKPSFKRNPVTLGYKPNWASGDGKQSDGSGWASDNIKADNGTTAADDDSGWNDCHEIVTNSPSTNPAAVAITAGVTEWKTDDTDAAPAAAAAAAEEDDGWN